MASACGLVFCVLRVIYVLAVVTNCPPETGGTSAKRGGGGLKGERRDNYNQLLFSRKDRRERKVLFTFRISRLRWSGRKLRYDKSAQRVFIHPLPPAGGETDPSPALPCMGGSSYNRLVPHQQNIILPSLVANGALGGLTETTFDARRG